MPRASDEDASSETNLESTVTSASVTASVSSETIETFETVTTTTIVEEAYETMNQASAFDVSEGSVWKKKSSNTTVDASSARSVDVVSASASRAVLNASASSSSSGESEVKVEVESSIESSIESSVALEADARSGFALRLAASAIDAETFRKGTNVFTAGTTSLVAIALGSAAAGVAEALESIPLLQSFEEAIGVAVSAYYANKLSDAFVTAEGREAFRLRLVENFTRVTGGANTAALAGKLARTDSELNAQIKGLIGNVELLPEKGEEFPESVRNVIADFIRNRDGDVLAEIEALRSTNASMRDQVDAIEMLQTELAEAKRETTFARANIKVMNLGEKERRRLEEEARRARAEGDAMAEALREEMASMAADAAAAALRAEKAIQEERQKATMPNVSSGAEADAEAEAAADAAAEAAAEAEAAAAAEAAEAAARLAASQLEIAELKRKLAEALAWGDEVVSGMEKNKERELRAALAEAERRREREIAAEIADSRDLILEERRKAAEAIEAAREEAARAVAAEIEALTAARASQRAKEASEEEKFEARFAEELAAKLADATAEASAELRRYEAELSSARAEVSETETKLREAKKQMEVQRLELEKRVAEAVANAERALEVRFESRLAETTERSRMELARATSDFEKRTREEVSAALAETLHELDVAKAEAVSLRDQLDSITASAKVSLDSAMAEAERALAEETRRANEASSKLATAEYDSELSVALERSLEEARANSRRALDSMERYASEAASARRDAKEARDLASFAESKVAELSRELALKTEDATARSEKMKRLERDLAETAAFANAAVETARGELREAREEVADLKRASEAELAASRRTNQLELERALAAAELENQRRLAEAALLGTSDLEAFKRNSEEVLRRAVQEAEAAFESRVVASVAEAERRAADASAEDLRAERRVRVELETRLEKARAELERRLVDAQEQTETQRRVAGDIQMDLKRVVSENRALESQLRARDLELERFDLEAVASQKDAEKARDRFETETKELSSRLRDTESRLAAAQSAAAKASEDAKSFASRLAKAEREIAEAATAGEGASLDAEGVSQSTGRVARLEKELFEAVAARARAESQVDSSLREYEAAKASALQRETDLRAALALATDRAAEAERRAEAFAARLVAGAETDEAVSKSGSETDETLRVGNASFDVRVVSLAALSTMKKSELIAELAARGLAVTGIVAELRQRLRDARSADSDSGAALERAAAGASSGTVSKEKKTVGPNESALKRPLSSYMLFAQFSRVEITRGEPGISVVEVGKRLGAAWKLLAPAEKSEWRSKAKALKAEYDENLKLAREKDLALKMASASDGERRGRNGTSYYQVIDGVRYDRKVLDDCRLFQKSEGRIDLQEAERVFVDVFDGPVKMQERGKVSSVTDVEITTLRFALENFAWTDEARVFVEAKLREAESL